MTEAELEFYSPHPREHRWRLKTPGKVIAYSSAFESKAALMKSIEIMRSKFSEQREIEVTAISQKITSVEDISKENRELIRRLISTMEDETFLRPKFVESSPAQRTFGEMVENICHDILGNRSKEVEMCIMGYFDQAMLDRLKLILQNGGKVKIISPELKKTKSDKTNLDALKRMRKRGASVKIHPMLHARIFYATIEGNPWGVIIGSGDIKSDCLGGRRFDAGIWSNYPDVIRATIDFFKRVWEDERAIELSELK